MKRADIICTMSQLKPATEKEKLELLEWKDILNELDNTLNNNERRHAEHRDYTDVSKVCGLMMRAN